MSKEAEKVARELVDVAWDGAKYYWVEVCGQRVQEWEEWDDAVMLAEDIRDGLAKALDRFAAELKDER